jgi:hypothetical protein
MRQIRSGDAWAEGQLRRAEEVLTEARAFSIEGQLRQAREGVAEARALRARGVLHHGPRPTSRGARVWLGSVLLAIGHRLLRSAPGPAAPA